MSFTKLIGKIPLLHAEQSDTDQKLTSAEQGKLWATYIGNTMSICVLSYMVRHAEDQEIKEIVKHALGLSQQFVTFIRDVYKHENYPIPKGFTDEDVNLDAPPLFADEFYLHYLKYLGKAGLGVYAIAIPLVTRSDIRAFFTECTHLTVQLMNTLNETMIKKGLLTKPAYIPYPTEIDFIKKQGYLNGFFGDIRPLQALEITHLYDNTENNATSKAVLLGFSQTAQSKEVRDYFHRGLEIANKHYTVFTKILQEDYLSAPPSLDPLVLNSTRSPFSDKLMLFHKMDMFTVRIRAYGNALSMSARHDIASKYGRLMLEVGNYVEDGANIMIEHAWMEQPPQAADRGALAKT
ncbi:hypothetical protein FHS18_006751 [Paenibacillus phyllosphaerae]|uniref:DUF3231 family protein n=1 Tax=Paenibacillus phyllosphaerae TaxID=274593 RepID=A0A7W5FRQ5_9BACL|nr:DUF3231 family protein [Paenibacillus phyllosphaerae]MBB3114613.1 hypothetical protein [Paenibacillus phyllosphaerae]